MKERPPWRIDVSDLLSEPGSTRSVAVAGAMDQITVGISHTAGGRPVSLDASMESATDGVSLRGRIGVEWVGQCRRCLEQVEGDAVIDVDELFVVDHVEGETYALGDGIIDLSPMVIDAIGLSLPLTPLCSTDCPGPQPQRFPVRTEDGDTGVRATDPRWAALDALRADVADE